MTSFRQSHPRFLGLQKPQKGLHNPLSSAFRKHVTLPRASKAKNLSLGLGSNLHLNPFYYPFYGSDVTHMREDTSPSPTWSCDQLDIPTKNLSGNTVHNFWAFVISTVI